MSHEFMERIRELQLAIAKHREQKADDRCIEDDDKLYAAMGVPSRDPVCRTDCGDGSTTYDDRPRPGAIGDIH